MILLPSRVCIQHSQMYHPSYQREEGVVCDPMTHGKWLSSHSDYDYSPALFRGARSVVPTRASFGRHPD